ncbi:MAG TPA: glycosyltransferase family 39 protein [Patescibacteria group bacterium]
MITAFLKNRSALFSLATVVYILLFVISLSLGHRETDEVVYQTLGMQLFLHHSYSLQGTDMLRFLPKAIYDTPIFFHPPVFPFILGLLYVVGGAYADFLIPPLIFVFITIFIYKLAFKISQSETTAVKAYVLALFSPMLLLTATKLHLDLLMTLFIVLAFYFEAVSFETQKKKDIIFSGICITLALLTRYTAILAVPFLLFWAIQKRVEVKKIALFFLPMVVFGLWLLYFFAKQGFIGFTSTAPTAESILHYPFLYLTVKVRKWYFYFTSIFLVNPSLLFLFWYAKKSIYKKINFSVILFGAFALTLLVAMTIMGVAGYGFQMRYIVAVEPFLLIIIAMLPIEKNKSVSFLLLLFLVHNVLLFFYNGIIFQSADMTSFLERLVYHLH